MTVPLAGFLAGMSDEQIARVVAALPEPVIAAMTSSYTPAGADVPPGPLEQAQTLDPTYRERPHLRHLSDRLAQAVHDVEAGQSRFLAVSMPPRSGKSTLASVHLPLWVLRRHPSWRVGLLSHSPLLATSWGRQVRREVERHRDQLGLRIARDAGAVSEWQTEQGGGVMSRSVGQSVTGFGFRVACLDDLTKDFAAAHSQAARDAVWDWYLANAYTRLEPPFLVLAIATRWHGDDFLGRVLSPEHQGDPGVWEQIVFPAIAQTGDALGRNPGDPLLSPLVNETREQALERWEGVRAAVGPYVWQALYQQDPAPAEGAIFNIGAFRYWTHDRELAAQSGAVWLRREEIAAGEIIDSWDTAFKGGDSSDFVVGQRWARVGRYRVLLAQQRGRWTFTQTVAAMRAWAGPDPSGVVSPFGGRVGVRLVEDSANGPAIIDALRDEVTGIRPWTARGSKESRYRAVTPEVERGEVLLPLPSEAGNGWVSGLLGELREAPHGKHDDAADALAQALLFFGDGGGGVVTVPSGVVGRPGLGRVVESGRRGVGVGGPVVSGLVGLPRGLRPHR